MLTTTIILLAAALVLAVAIQYLGIGELVISSTQQQSEQAFEIADSCVQNALLRIKNNSAYAGETLTVGSGSCVITVTGSGSSRTISSVATMARATQKIIAIINISGTTISITSWKQDNS